MRDLTDKEMKQAVGGLGVDKKFEYPPPVKRKNFTQSLELSFPPPSRAVVGLSGSQCHLKPFTYKTPYIKKR